MPFCCTHTVVGAAAAGGNIQLIKVVRPKLDIVQDAYSLRCTPQVHGVVYELVQEVRQQLALSLNKPQGRFVVEGGKKIVNLLYRSQGDTMLLDSLGCALN